MQITVLGAGISGVTTALRLQSALPKASINITAEHFSKRKMIIVSTQFIKFYVDY